jgi:hypothetical protein
METGLKLKMFHAIGVSVFILVKTLAFEMVSYRVPKYWTWISGQ